MDGSSSLVLPRQWFCININIFLNASNMMIQLQELLSSRILFNYIS